LEQSPSSAQPASLGTDVVVVVEVLVAHGQRSSICSPTALLRQINASLAVVLPSPEGSQTQARGVQA
jgi:hypothetical protein